MSPPQLLHLTANLFQHTSLIWGIPFNSVKEMSIRCWAVSGLGSPLLSSPASLWPSLPVADTSISDEDILALSGSVSNLPDPILPIGIACLIFIGVLVLQFSLGDLTKEEGQARVKDFLQTKKDTERKGGYFD
eukprot:scaffold2470_cov158-Ochromonas_danica.AAC.8